MDTDAVRLERIETKLDQLADTVVALARVEEKIDDLETRRKESHERVNRLSEKIDHVHAGVHKIEARLGIVEKVVWAVAASFIVAVVTQLMDVIQETGMNTNREYWQQLWQEAVSEKKKLDPVGKADADIDNDGDTDSSDEYLHNRRKAIKKAMSKEEAEVEEKRVCPKCDGKGCDHCDGKGTHEAYESMCGLKASKKYKKEAVMHNDHGYGEIIAENEDGSVDVLFDGEVKFGVSSEELTPISEFKITGKKATHYGSATKPEGILDKAPDAAKSFVAQHQQSDKGVEDAEAESHVDATKAGRVTKQAPTRRGDQRKGDTKVVNPVKGAVMSTTGKEG